MKKIIILCITLLFLSACAPHKFHHKKCEYNGTTYSLGSIVEMGGDLKECRQTGRHSPAWENVQS